MSDLPYPKIVFLDPEEEPPCISLYYMNIATYNWETNQYTLAPGSATHYVNENTIVVYLPLLLVTFSHEDLHWVLYKYNGYSASSKFDNIYELAEQEPEYDKFVKFSYDDGWYDGRGRFYLPE